MDSKDIETALTLIGDTQQRINQELIAEYCDEDDDGEFDAASLPRGGYFIENDHPRISACHLGDMLALEYFGPDYGPGWDGFLELTANPDVANTIGDLRIGGPDQGANGIRTYDFEELLRKGTGFPMLRNLWIRPSDPGDHNYSGIADGHLEKLLGQMPALEQLTIPRPIDLKNMNTELPNLSMLSTGSEYRHYHFVERMAESNSFPALVYLDFGDALEPWMSPGEGSEDYCATPFAHYEKFAQSKVAEQMWGFRLRNACLSKAEYQKLQAIRPDWQFSIVLAPPHSYVSHWENADIPYEYLLPNG